MTDHQGLFIWYELITTDPEGAKAFYADVVGWTTSDMDMGGMIYTIVEAGGQGVGGLMLIPPEAKAMGAPPCWTGYVAVDDCDAAAAKATSLGGSVMKAPADIPGVGRFAIVADPHGAAFAIMTPAPMETERARPPMRTPGQASWHELYAGDLDQAWAFYSALFGWRKDEAMDMGPMGTYQLFANQDGVVGAMMKAADGGPKPTWNFYFQVGDIDAAAARVKAGGGQILSGPMEVPGEDWVFQGRDPHGASFALVGKKS